MLKLFKFAFDKFFTLRNKFYRCVYFSRIKYKRPKRDVVTWRSLREILGFSFIAYHSLLRCITTFDFDFNFQRKITNRKKRNITSLFKQRLFLNGDDCGTAST